MKTRRVLRGAGAAGLALALTACLKVDMDLEINTDETVDGTIIMGLSRDFMDMAGSMGDGAETEDMLDSFLNMDTEGEDVPDYATVEPYEDDEYVGQQVTFDGAPLDEFGGTAETSEMSIVHEGEEFILDGSMNMSDSGTGEMADVPPGMLEGMNAEMRVSFTFPGEVLEHNGSLDGTTVTWEPQIGEPNEMFARSLDSGGGGGDVPAWLWIVIGVVVVAGLVTLLYVLSRSRGAQPATADGAASSAAAAPTSSAATSSAATSTGDPVRSAPAPESVTPPPPPAPSDTTEDPGGAGTAGETGREAGVAGDSGTESSELEGSADTDDGEPPESPGQPR